MSLDPHLHLPPAICRVSTLFLEADAGVLRFAREQDDAQVFPSPLEAP